MQICYRCRGVLPTCFLLGDKESEWRYTNAAPNAASGGTMVPVHVKCDPIGCLTFIPVEGQSVMFFASGS